MRSTVDYSILHNAVSNSSLNVQCDQQNVFGSYFSLILPALVSFLTLTEAETQYVRDIKPFI